MPSCSSYVSAVVQRQTYVRVRQVRLAPDFQMSDMDPRNPSMFRLQFSQPCALICGLPQFSTG